MLITDKVIRMLLVHSRCLLDGVRGRTLKSAELHHDVLVGAKLHHRLDLPRVVSRRHLSADLVEGVILDGEACTSCSVAGDVAAARGAHRLEQYIHHSHRACCHQDGGVTLEVSARARLECLSQLHLEDKVK